MNWFHKMSARAKLMLAFLCVCGILSGVAITALVKMASVNATVTYMYNYQLLPISALGRSHAAMIDVGRQTRAVFSSADKQAKEKCLSNLEACKKTFAKYYDGVVVPGADTAEEKAMTVKIKELFAKYSDESLSIIAQSIKGDDEGAKKRLSEVKSLADEAEKVIEDELQLNERMAQDGEKASEAAYNFSFWMVVSLVSVGSATGLIIGWLIARWFTKALIEVSAIADSVASASQQLAAASEELSSGAQEQASSLEETASSLEEITGTIQQNADNAQQANQLAGRSREVAEKGGSVVEQAVKGMAEINAASRKIADIITAIDEIAFQTNLLALNAAVEAARAGEQGRGFAVVAGEVRNLAQRSAGAAKEIKGLIQDSVSKVEIGSKLVNQSGETLSEIVTSVKRVTDVVSEIAAASREQASGIDQVNKAVTQMDQVTQGNASQTEELSGTAESLSAQAAQLQELVAQFNLVKRDVFRSTTASHPAPRAATRVAKKSIAPTRKKPTSKPASKQAPANDDLETRVEQELELMGVGASGNGKGGFEEF